MMVWRLVFTFAVLNIYTCYGQVYDPIEILSSEIFLSERGHVFLIEKNESGITFIKAGISKKIVKQKNNRLYYTNTTTRNNSIIVDTLYYELQALEKNKILVLSNYYYDKTVPMTEKLFPQIFTPSEAEPITLLSFERAIRSKAYELNKMKVWSVKRDEVYFQYSPFHILMNYKSLNDTISLVDKAIKAKFVPVVNDLAISYYSNLTQSYPATKAKDCIIEFDHIELFCDRGELERIIDLISKVKYAPK